MSWFSYINKLTKCSEIRERQLQKEKKIDENLKKCDCDKIVKEYLLEYRELNRSMSDELYRTHLFEIPSIISKQLEIVDDHLRKIEDIDNPCKELPDIIKIMNASHHN